MRSKFRMELVAVVNHAARYLFPLFSEGGPDAHAYLDRSSSQPIICAVTLLRKACKFLGMEVHATYPDITAELQFAGEAKEGRLMDEVVHLKNEAEFEARKVRAFIFGNVEVKGMVEAETLKAGEAT